MEQQIQEEAIPIPVLHVKVKATFLRGVGVHGRYGSQHQGRDAAYWRRDEQVRLRQSGVRTSDQQAVVIDQAFTTPQQLCLSPVPAS